MERLVHKLDYFVVFKECVLAQDITSVLLKIICRMIKHDNYLQWNSTLLKIVNNFLNTNIYSYLETSGGQSYKLY